MNPSFPLPLRAVQLVSKYLKSVGINLPLNVLQEAVARSRGHNSFQHCLAEAAPKDDVMGLRLYCVQGREAGDDDDSVAHFWAESEYEADCRFVVETLELEVADPDYDGPAAYFLISTECIGQMVNDEFILTKAYRP